MTSFRTRMLWRALALFTASAGALGVGAAWSAPVGDALDRPAVMSPRAAQAVLLGAAHARNRLVAVGERGIVLLSDDDGASWRQVPAPVSVTLTSVGFADAKHGYIVGHGGTVLTTTDGGETWTLRLDGRRAAEIALAAAGRDERTARDAERLVSDGPDKPFLDVLVQDAQHAVVVGAYGLAFATTDGGQSWTSWMARLDNPKGLHLYAIRHRGGRILVTGEQGLARLSDDDGCNFAAITPPYAGSFFTAALPDASAIVLAGLRGNVWRSADSGATWAQVPVPMPITITTSALQPDGSLLFANQAGFVMGERQGALSPLNKNPLPPVNGVLPLRNGTVLALDIYGTSLVKPGDPQ